jgi:chitodextrinase
MSVRLFLRAAVAVALVLATAPAASSAPRRDRTPPTAPADLRVTAVSQTSVSLAWSPSTDNVGVASYSLWGEGLSGVQSVAHPQTSATWSSLRPGQTVTFRVTAYDAQFNASPASTAVTVTTPADTTAPSAPSGLSVESVSGSKVLLRWTSATDDFGPVTHQVLVDGVPTADAFSTVAPGTFPRPPVQGAWVRQLDPGTTYRFSVRAVDGAGNGSAASNTVSATTEPSPDTVAPTTPTLLSAFDGGPGQCPEELWLRWTASTDDVDPASTIDYEVRINGRINEVDTGFAGTVTYTEVHGPNTVTVVAVDRAGNASAPSNAITVNNPVTC